MANGTLFFLFSCFLKNSPPLSLLLSHPFFMHPNSLEIPAMLGFVDLGHGYPYNLSTPEELLWLINQRSLMQISTLPFFIEYIRKY